MATSKKVEAVYEDIDRLIGAYAHKQNPPKTIKLSRQQWDILEREHDKMLKESGDRIVGPVAYKSGYPVYRGFRLERYAE